MPAESAERALAVNLGAGRVAIGAALWLAPRLSARVLGFDNPNAPTLAVARIAASRDLVLGAWQLSSLDDPEQLAKASMSAAICDAGDTVAFAVALRDPATRAAAFAACHWPRARPSLASGSPRVSSAPWQGKAVRGEVRGQVANARRVVPRESVTPRGPRSLNVPETTL